MLFGGCLCTVTSIYLMHTIQKICIISVYKFCPALLLHTLSRFTPQSNLFKIFISLFSTYKVVAVALFSVAVALFPFKLFLVAEWEKGLWYYRCPEADDASQ